MRDVSKIVSIDTLFEKQVANRHLNHVLHNHVFEYRSENFNFTVNPAGNFEWGGQFNDTTNSWVNARGFHIAGDITNTVFFATSFYEIQSLFNDYRQDRIDEIGGNTVPGQISGAKPFRDMGALDYGFAESYISYTPSDIFDFQLGHGKLFLGDGYRSLLWSDNAKAFPYFKITTDIWNIKYVNMWSQQMYFHDPVVPNERNPIKWNVMHYLDWSVTEWLNLGLFETIIWGNEDTLGNYRGFEFHYLNPVIFLRPVEFHIGSPDNVTIGVTGKLTLFKNHIFYGQVGITEFKLEEMRARNQWWGNKYVYQLGYKTFNAAGIKNLDFQTEYNYVRPFMYSHFMPSQQYGHALQPLAHPRGANFYESVSFLRYRYKRLSFEGKVQYLVFGQDTAGVNYGNDIFKLYQTRTLEHGNITAKYAVSNTVWYKDLMISYLINPKNNMNLAAGISHRSQSSILGDKNQFMYFIAFRTSLYNAYYDF